MALVKDDWAAMPKTNDWRTSTMFRKKTKSIEAEVDVLWQDNASASSTYQLFNYLTQPSRQPVLHRYFDRFDLQDMRLDTAFRKVTRKLFFGSARPIEFDRVLEAFARRYWKCNLHEIYGSVAVVYVVIYSLLLLNTKLYIKPEQKRNESHNTIVAEHCQETMKAVCARESTARTTILASGGVDKWLTKMRICLEALSLSVRQKDLFSDSVSVPNDIAPQTYYKAADRSLQRRLSSSSAWTWTSLRRKDVQREKKGPYKEGPLACKCVVNATAHSETVVWKPCWVILDRGSLFIYIHKQQDQQPQDIFYYQQELIDSTVNHQHHNSNYHQCQQKRPYLNTELHLAHALACPTVDEDEERPFVFRLLLANGRSYMFDCGSEEQVLAWVNQSNYWAARESKIPSVKATSIQSIAKPWSPPPPPAGTSLLDPARQRQAIKRHLAQLCFEYDRHLAEHDAIEELPVEEHKQAYASWSDKRQYYAFQVKRYTYYEDAMERSFMSSSASDVSSDRASSYQQ
ncbi:hypothetical protein BCR43DRAFT_482744 [Syncephalastrum racemosum]|uniref:SEC7 domain-containing protein n=1 Tax=Syncephalastrum racemosum TaxID=13706 RepID=A0A1X2HU38_SYNRA|nr:hypothetical protein BCR43DRAFT_482744 [Syncephalastrum racemosum]